MLNQQHPLFLLANKIDWQQFEDNFRVYYSKKKGRPSKPVRLMCGLLMLKHIRNLSDESVVEQWSENAYYQYFCGEVSFATKSPYNPTELVNFRKRIGEAGIELILKESIRVEFVEMKMMTKMMLALLIPRFKRRISLILQTLNCIRR